MRTTIGSLSPDQNLLDPFIQVGLDAAIKPRIAVNHLLDGGDRLVVVDLGIDADPVLAVGNADDFVRQERLADMCAEVADPGYRPQLTADRLGDAQHFWVRRAGIGYPMDQEVPLLERWQQRIPEERPGC